MAADEDFPAHGDSAKAIKEAFRIFADNICTVLGEDNLTADYKKLRITITAKNGNRVSVALRQGCSSLGYKGENGEWKMLPDDYILYTAKYDPNVPFSSQFHIFTNEEFIQMWRQLGLIRYKVSTSAGNKLRKSGMLDVISIEKYADTITVQSFYNSGKKKKALEEYLKTVPPADEKYIFSLIKKAED